MGGTRNGLEQLLKLVRITDLQSALGSNLITYCLWRADSKTIADWDLGFVEPRLQYKSMQANSESSLA